MNKNSISIFLSALLTFPISQSALGAKAESIRPEQLPIIRKFKNHQPLKTFIQEVGPSFDKATRTFIEEKSKPASDLKFRFVERGQNEFLVEVGSTLIPMTFGELAEDGTLHFKVNNKTVVFDDVQTPEERWAALEAAMPKQTSGRMNLVIPRAEALIFLAPILGVTALGVGVMYGTSKISLCPKTREVLPLCNDQKNAFSEEWISLGEKIANGVRYTNYHEECQRLTFEPFKACLNRRLKENPKEVSTVMQQWLKKPASTSVGGKAAGAAPTAR